LLVSAPTRVQISRGIRAGGRATGEYESSERNSLSGLGGRENDDFLYETVGKIAKPFDWG
jgi:hypothetical protein